MNNISDYAWLEEMIESKELDVDKDFLPSFRNALETLHEMTEADVRSLRSTERLTHEDYLTQINACD
jgi:hypothetical protein